MVSSSIFEMDFIEKMVKLKELYSHIMNLVPENIQQKVEHTLIIILILDMKCKLQEVI